MKKVIQTVIFLAILLVSSFGVYAQGSIEGKVTTFNHGVTIQYSVSGGEMLKEEFSEDRHHVTYECEVEEGSTINVSASRLSGPEGIDEIYIKHTFLDSGRDDIVVKKNGTVTMLYTLKDDESRIIRQMETTITVMHASSGSQVTIKWKVVKKESDSGSGSGSGSGSAWYSKQTATNCRVCKRPWSHIEVKDYYGDASIRCDEDDDDGYESLEFDTHIYCKDRIKAGKDSEIVLGLADRSAFTIKENSIVVMPEDPGEVSDVKMIMGIIWLNFKNMVTTGEMRIDGTQAVMGIKGTIVAAKETGKETRFWLFAGKADVTSRKTGKVTTLEPGQMTITGKDGKTVVKAFDIEAGARKLGIPMSDIENYNSNAGKGSSAQEVKGSNPLVWILLGAGGFLLLILVPVLLLRHRRHKPKAAPAPAFRPKFCTHCGAPVSSPNANFCTRCGHPLQ